MKIDSAERSRRDFLDSRRYRPLGMLHPSSQMVSFSIMACMAMCVESVNLKLIIHRILEDYALPIHGDHGVSHWARVLENGRRLSEMTGASLTVVSLFALFHDSRRVNECTDDDHGLRGAEFAAELRGQVFDVSDQEFHLLYRAC